VLEDLKIELEGFRVAGKLKTIHVAGTRRAGMIEIRGKSLVDFTNWDALELGHNQKVKRAAQSTIESDGISSASSRLLAGTSTAHLACESHISKFLNTEATLLFSSKNQALLSLITALCGEQDSILVDDLLIGPVLDAAYLVNADAGIFTTDNLSSLEGELRKSGRSRRKLVFVESISSVTGNKTDLDTICEISARNGALVVVDESFALGTSGLRGAGSVEFISPSSTIFAKYGDLSLGLAGFGGFVSGSKLLLSVLVQRSRTLLNETAVPAALAASAEQSILVSETQSAARKRIAILASKLRRGLKSLAPGVPSDEYSPLVCVRIDKISKAVEISEALVQRGFFVDVVPRGTSRDESAVIRFIISISHTEDQIDDLIQAFEESYRRIILK